MNDMTKSGDPNIPHKISPSISFTLSFHNEPSLSSKSFAPNIFLMTAVESGGVSSIVHVNVRVSSALSQPKVTMMLKSSRLEGGDSSGAE